jgi:hypothetical protein
LRHYVRSRKVAGSKSDEVNDFFLICLILPALGFTQPLIEMSFRSRKIMFPRSRARPARKVDVTDICEPIVYKIWDLRRLRTLWAS